MRTFRRSKQYLGDRPESGATACAHPGCSRPGIYRAPRDRALTEYLWLCLDHVREYNARWDYYRGLTQAEIEQELRRDTVWQRPTWRLGDKGSAAHVFREGRARVKDPFSVFEEGGTKAEGRREAPAAPPGSPAYAMEIMQLEHPLTRQALKMRYHELVKRHHPDRHGGAKDAEERLKVINEAYAILQRHLDADARRTAV